MKRGEIWTVSGGRGYAGKPRPAVIVQDDRFETRSVTVCLFTSDPTDAPLLRPEIVADDLNRLTNDCRLMIDKVSTVARDKLGERIGALSQRDIIRLNRALVVFLGIAS